MKAKILVFLMALAISQTAYAAPLTATEADLIARTVEAEAGNQDFEGKRLVAAVILNRVESEDFPNTVEGVLAQEGQFATYKRLSRTQTTFHDLAAVQLELSDRSNDEVLFFRTGRYGCGEPLMKHGDHYFSTIRKE